MLLLFIDIGWIKCVNQPKVNEMLYAKSRLSPWVFHNGDLCMGKSEIALSFKWHIDSLSDFSHIVLYMNTSRHCISILMSYSKWKTKTWFKSLWMFPRGAERDRVTFVYTPTSKNIHASRLSRPFTSTNSHLSLVIWLRASGSCAG